MLEVHVPDHVHHHVEPSGNVVMINTTAGVWFALNSTAGDLWQFWVAGIGFEEAIAHLGTQYDEIPLSTIRQDAQQLLSELVAQGLLAVTAPEPTAGVEMVGARPRASGEAPRRMWARRLLAIASYPLLIFSALLVRVSFRSAHALVRATRTGWCVREPSADHAADIVAAVGQAARYFPTRAACLEVSLASVLLAALFRRRLNWCLGSAPDPYRFHAWVESEGHVVRDRGIGGEQPAFLKVLAV